MSGRSMGHLLFVNAGEFGVYILELLLAVDRLTEFEQEDSFRFAVRLIFHTATRGQRIDKVLSP